ncbi:MAG: hypothetical protein C5B55_06725 [Blastocatellia bacterium]|nr:MAG: hypothetical protein C5B55_06725 [Blastocatellia bacterium]
MITNEPTPLQSSFPDTPQISEQQVPAQTLSREIDPNNPPWAAESVRGLVKAIITWVGSVLCLLFVPLVLVVPYFVYRYLTSHMRPDQMASDKTFLFLSILGVIPAHLVTLLIVWVVVTQWGRYPFWKTVGMTWPPHWSPSRTVGLCIGLSIVLLAFGGVITNWFGGQKTQLDELIESSYQARVATAFLAFATGPLIEELVYRGVIYPALARIAGVAGAVVIVSVMFAGVHVWQYHNNLAVIGVIFILSITLTVVRAVTGRLLPSFLIHLVFNGLQSLYLLLQPLFEKSQQTPTKVAPAIDALVSSLRHLM